MPPAIALTGVSKAFGDTVAVQPLDLEIRQNEFFSILGPSGCGKTTLMRMVAGFVEPDSGSVELGGSPVTGQPTRQRDLNMVFQSYALFPHLTVAENVAFELRVRHLPRQEIRPRVAEALGLVRLGHLARRMPDQLSGGQRQRVALARAVVGRPAVVLLDEPLGALDLQLRREMQVELKRLQREVGSTFVYVTHDQEEALTMSDRIAVMSGGRLLQVGTPVEIYEEPTSRFVASFIGSCNVLDATTDSGSVVIDGVGPVPATGTDGLVDGTEIGLAVRPERISILPETVSGDGFAAPGHLAAAVYTGHEWRLTVTLADDVRVQVRVPSGQVDRSLVERGVGRAVRVSWAAEHARALAA